MSQFSSLYFNILIFIQAHFCTPNLEHVFEVYRGEECTEADFTHIETMRAVSQSKFTVFSSSTVIQFTKPNKQNWTGKKEELFIIHYVLIYWKCRLRTKNKTRKLSGEREICKHLHAQISDLPKQRSDEPERKPVISSGRWVDPFTGSTSCIREYIRGHVLLFLSHSGL